MRHLNRVHSKVPLVLIALCGAFLFHPASAGTLCAGMPQSILEVYDIKAATVQEVTVPTDELERSGEGGDLASRHTLMLSVSSIVTLFEIMHRMIPGDDSLVCDAPSRVRMGFGLSRRRIFLASAAAEDACIRKTMLDHEAAHTRALNEAVERFIDRHASDFKRAVAALKEMPAPSAAIAKARWETGLRAVVTEARRSLLAELRSASDQTDDPAALAMIDNACNGKVRELEHRSG
jgi:hypothetical protein